MQNSWANLTPSVWQKEMECCTEPGIVDEPQVPLDQADLVVDSCWSTRFSGIWFERRSRTSPWAPETPSFGASTSGSIFRFRIIVMCAYMKTMATSGITNYNRPRSFREECNRKAMLGSIDKVPLLSEPLSTLFFGFVSTIFVWGKWNRSTSKQILVWSSNQATVNGPFTWKSVFMTPATTLTVLLGHSDNMEHSTPSSTVLVGIVNRQFSSIPGGRTFSFHLQRKDVHCWQRPNCPSRHLGRHLSGHLSTQGVTTDTPPPPQRWVSAGIWWCPFFRGCFALSGLGWSFDKGQNALNNSVLLSWHARLKI